MLQALTLDRPARPSSLVRSAAVAFFATVTLAVTSSSAFAGATELKALTDYLAGLTPSTTPATASADVLADAVIHFSTPPFATNNPKKLSPAIIAGEALKATTKPDTGTVIGTKVSQLITFPLDYGVGPTKAIDKKTFATLAIKATSTGKLPTVAEVPAFTAAITLSNADAIIVAGGVKGSKVAAGAVLQGQASTISALADKSLFANSALNDKGLTAAIQESTAGIAATVNSGVDAKTFTKSLIDTNASTSLVGKNLLKVIPGIVSGKPTDAGIIFEEALTNSTYAGLNEKSPIVKGIPALATSLSAIADIEQVAILGQSIAKQISTSHDVKGKPVPNLKLSTATATVTTLAKAIATKPFATTGANSLLNKEDELGELAAYFVAGLVKSPEFIAEKTVKGAQVAANADKAVLSIFKAVVTGAKLTAGKNGAPPTTTQISDYYTALAKYVAGSIATTVTGITVDGTPGTITAAVKNSILKAIGINPAGGALLPADQAIADKNLKAIAGVLKLDLTVLKNAIADATAATPLNPYENGFDKNSGGLNAAGVAIVDPETNARHL